MAPTHSLIVGSGIFGVTAARELKSRGHRVTLVDAGPIPHPDAASTDISKVIRMEYGADDHYMALVEESLSGWDAWNERWVAQGTGRLYHQTGVLMVCREPMASGGFEHDSWRLLRRRGHRPERMDATTLARRFPAWSTGNHVDGFYHARGGYTESGRVVRALVEWAAAEGVAVRERFRAASLDLEHDRAVGVVSEAGEKLAADEVVVAAGAWLGKLVPELAPLIRVSGHPVFHYRPADPAPFEPAAFPVFTADVARTGFYGFPLNPDGVVKIATHSLGVELDADAPRTVTAADEAHQRAFLRETFPALAEAPVAATRLCLYADTRDEDLWIDRHPAVAGLTVAGGGSGHGFKFAPVLGAIIADALEGRTTAPGERFRWRTGIRPGEGREAARHHG